MAMNGHKRKKMMETAVSLIGSPAMMYDGPEKGMSPKDGFDCSGFVTYVLQKAGIFVPHYVKHDGELRSVRHASEYFDHCGVPVHEEYASTGDLVFFSKQGVSPTHIGILTSHDTYIHSPGKDGMTVREEMLPVGEEREITPDPKKGRVIYSHNPIGFKALVAHVDEPTFRYHQQLLD